MFCPGCGLEEIQSNQFCRACGSDLRMVRSALERPDGVTASAMTAREEIGRAVAARIRETKSAKELAKVTEEVLPEIEKFLESPEEKRLRRMRAGTIIGSVGAGAALAFSIISIIAQEEDLFFMAAMGVVAFFIGLGFIINGMLLTIPKKTLTDTSSQANDQRALDAQQTPTIDLALPEATTLFSSVTEHTTKHLDEKEKVPRH
jgi:hypothetical protein